MASARSNEQVLIHNPVLETVTGYVGYLQEQNIFSKQRLQTWKQYSLLTIGFFILLYFLIHVQLLIYSCVRFFFGGIFKLFSFVFWLPLRTARFLIPKSIDYDILFPLFWLCSIASFYIGKYLHENLCQLYDRHLVRRYPILSYEQTKRDDIRRYLFIFTFIVLLLFQSVFILVPIAQSIGHQRSREKIDATVALVSFLRLVSSMKRRT
jgi:hypothetical protein